LFQCLQVDEFQSRDVGGYKVDFWGLPRLQCFQPARQAQTPLISGLQAGKIIFFNRGGEIIAHGFGEGQEFVGHFDTDGVHASILSTCRAEAGAEKTGHRVFGARLEFGAKYVSGHECILVGEMGEVYQSNVWKKENLLS
tara:strand:+ start:90 stop:509 length:420 start_codon:yes stop_codon:yes gene_type:complete